MIDLNAAPKLGDAPKAPSEADLMVMEMKAAQDRTGVSVCEQMMANYMRWEGIARLAQMRRCSEHPALIDEIAASMGLSITYEINPEIAAKLDLAAA